MQSQNPVNKVPFYFYFLIVPLCAIIKLWQVTLRLKMPKEQEQFALQKDKFFIMVWHNRIFVLPQLNKIYRSIYKMAGLVSASKDGAILAAIFRFFGIESVRGSSRKRKFASIVEIAEVAQSGTSICITPDGPIGPKCKLKRGSLKVAEFANIDVLFLRIKYRHYFTLPTWDKFMIPLPFSAVDLDIVKCCPYAELAAEAAAASLDPVDYAQNLMGE